MYIPLMVLALDVLSRLRVSTTPGRRSTMPKKSRPLRAIELSCVPVTREDFSLLAVCKGVASAVTDTSSVTLPSCS